MHHLKADNPADERLQEARAALKEAGRIAVLTGAGVSAASGLATFRGAGGLPRSRRAAELATPEAYRRDPELVWAWYYERFAQAALHRSPWSRRTSTDSIRAPGPPSPNCTAT